MTVAKHKVPRIAIVWNPIAGGGRARAQWVKLRGELRQNSIEYREFATEYRGHATALAREIGRGDFERIAVLGGDGTLHEVVQGLVADDRWIRPNLHLVALRGGTSGDFLKCLPPESSNWRRLMGVEMKRFDVLRLDFPGVSGAKAVYTLNCSHIGFAAGITQEIHRSGPILRRLKRWSVDLAMVGWIAKTLPRYRAESLKIQWRIPEASDVSCEPVVTLCVAKSQFISGRLRLGTPVTRSDGQLAVVSLLDVGMLQLPGVLWQALRRGAIHSRWVRCRLGHSLRVDRNPDETPLIVESDGEIVGETPVSYRVVPQLLPVVLPTQR